MIIYINIILLLIMLISTISLSYKILNKVNRFHGNLIRQYHARQIVSNEYSNNNNLIVNSTFINNDHDKYQNNYNINSANVTSIFTSYDDKSNTQSNPTPKELLYSALSSCTIMTIRTYYNNCKKSSTSNLWLSGILDDIEVRVIENNDENNHIPQSINLYIKLIGTLSIEQKGRLLTIANQCPVKQMIKANINTHIE